MDIASMVIDSPAKKVPRPLNCFMTYRLEKQKEILEKCPGTNHRDISKITATWWKELSADEKEPYRIKAHNAKFEHEQRYPNYKFSPKKKVTKTRAYKKRTDTAFMLQDIERKQNLYALCLEKSKTPQEAKSPSLTPTATTNTSATSSTKVEEPIKLDPAAEKEDICCANCYGSTKTCFSNPHKILKPSTTTTSSSSPYSVAYYDYPTATTTTTTTTYKTYGPTNSTTSTFPSYNLPMISTTGNNNNNKDYYTETKTTVSYASPSRPPFHSLAHSNYNHSPPSTIMPSPPLPIHPTSFYYHQ